MKKLTFVVAVMLGIGFLAVGLVQIFVEIGDANNKLNLCLFCLEALIGMSVIFFGFALNSFFKRYAEFEEKMLPESPHDEGFE